MDRLGSKPSDEPRGGESLVVGLLLPRHCRFARRFREPGRCADAPGIARLAGQRLCIERMGCQTVLQAGGPVGNLRSIFGSTRSELGVDRSGQQAPVPWPSPPSLGRTSPRCGLGRLRPASPQSRRTERDALSTPRSMGRGRDGQVLFAGQGRRALSPQHVHLLATHRSSPEHARLRCDES